MTEAFVEWLTMFRYVFSDPSHDPNFVSYRSIYYNSRSSEVQRNRRRGGEPVPELSQFWVSTVRKRNQLGGDSG